MKKITTTTLKILGWTILGIVALLILAALLIQTGFVKKRIAAYAEKQANTFINGEFTLGAMEGNFFTGIIIKNVLITQKGDTTGYIKEIKTTYNLLPLISGKLDVRSVQVSGPRIFLEQINDSTWNVQQLIKSSTDTTPADTSTSSFAINVNLLQLVDGTIYIKTADTLIPKEINNLKILLSGTYSADQQSLRMDEFSFNTRQPDVSLEKLVFSLKRDKESIILKNFNLKTAKNQLRGDADFSDAPERKGNASFNSEPIQISEFEFALPDLQLPATPVFSFDASLRNDSVNATVSIEDEDQKIVFDLASENLYTFLFNPGEVVLKYKVDGFLKNIDLAYWLNDPELKYLINGDLKASGEGTDPATAKVNLSGNFHDLLVQERPVDKLVMDFDFDHGNLSGFAKGNGDFGEFELSPDIQQIQDNPTYKIDLTTRKLNIAAITGNDSLTSSINMKANIRGRGFDPKKLALQANVMIKNSTLQQIKMDTLFADVQYNHENIQVDSLLLLTQSVVLSAKGNYNLKGRSAIDLRAKFSGLEEFSAFIPVDSLQTSGSVLASIRGPFDSLSLQTNVHLAQTSYPGYELDSLNVDGQAFIVGKDTTATANLQAFNLRSSAINLDSIVMDVDASVDSIFVDGRVKNQDLSTSIKAGIVPGDVLKITLDDLILDYKNQNWALQSPPASIQIAPESYTINNFNFASGSADSAQSIKANGTIHRKDVEDFTLEVANIDIRKLAEMTGQEIDASGLFDMNVTLSGQADNPKLAGKFGIDKAVMNNYKFTEFDGTFDLKNNKLKVEAQAVPQDSGRIELSGSIPLHLMMDSLTIKFNPSDPLEGLVRIEQFPLAILQTLNITENIAGYAEGEIEVGGSIEAPKPNGNFRLVNAAVKVPEYGVDYQTIALNVSFTPEKVMIDTFNIKSVDGSMKATGEVNFNSDFYKGNISDSKLNITFDQFNPVDHKQFNMQLSGNASLQGKTGDVVFDSDLTIPQSEFNLPAIMSLFGKFNAPEMPTPLLVREMTEHDHTGDSLVYNVKTKPEQDTTAAPGYFDRLRGKARIKIPKNTWVKSEDMRIELSGDLELIKSNEFFEVFGTVDVVRGQYDLMGKTFIIDKGNITFQGGEAIMPQLDIIASYTFRNAQREEQKLTANISGVAEEPKIEFNLDGNAINEGDALSYILFGKSLDELSLAQQDNMQSNGSLAGNAAASLLSAQLTKFLGNKLNVDYIEFNSSGNFDNASLEVGKYITNDLFVSYEQRIGQSNEDDLSDYEVKLEYEVFRFLFLQLNNSDRDSGFDVIFKIEAE
ncbi:MAG: translocation/assembly module TamB domain-containing protein [Lentimicrobium sp.]|jgi:translocation and assembly module TamB|nr:translocation/assembly module TamB domain-containing protein [Lentimicrobium sp.]